MNKDQYIYDLGVQFSNRTIDIHRLEMKLFRLKRLRELIYSRGQLDKKQNGRRETLLEYRQKISRCDLDMHECESFLTLLKQRNGLIAKNIQADPPRIRSKSVGRCKMRRNTPKYPIDADAMSAVAEVLINDSDLDNISPEIREWIKKYYGVDAVSQTNSPTDENKSFQAVDAINDEIEKTSRDIQRERCCFW